MKPREVLRVRHLLVGALLLFDAYVGEGLGTEDERASAAPAIAALLEEVRERLLEKELRAR